jgi:carboxyl-terminal processing protease
MRFESVLRCLSIAVAIGSFGSSTATSVESRAAARLSPTNSAQSAGQEAETRVAQFEKVCSTIQSRFYDKKLNGVDWAHVCDTYRGKLSGVKSKAEFKALVNQMLGELHASHTSYVDDTDIEYSMLGAVMDQDLQGHKIAHIGLMGHPVGAEFLVTAVYDGGPAQRAGLISGDRILSVDNKPFETAGSFKGKEGQAVALQIRHEGSIAVQTVAVTPVKQNVVKAFLDATAQSARVLNVGNRKIGYVHLWTMGNDAFKTTLDQLVTGKLHDTDGLILDLRDGYGGNPFGYTDVFYRPDVAWEQQYHGTLPNTHFTGYDKPMVALINGGSRSAKEFFTYQLKKTRRAVIVGTPTAGAFLGAGKVDIGLDGMLELAIVGLRIDGKRLEGTGVSPDIEVPIAHAYTDSDTQLLRGEQILTDQLQRKSGVIATHVSGL